MKITAGYQFSLALKNDGTVVGWGQNDLEQTNVPNGMGEIRDISAGIQHSVALAYSDALEYPVNVAQDLLLIYNTNSADSIFVKDHYLAHRPLVSQANVLGIGYAKLETITPTDFTNHIRTPVLNWLAENSTKRPKYWILFLDLPSRINDFTNTSTVGEYAVALLNIGSVSHELSLLPGAKSPLITCINMGNTNHVAETNDCRAYIDKLAFFGSNYSPGKVIISASGGGYGNTNFCFEGVNPNASGGVGYDRAVSASNAIYSVSLSTANILCRLSEPHISAGTNVTGYFTPGIYSWHGAPGTYATDGTIVFKGASSWYIMMSNESFNGRRYQEIFLHGHFIKWFSESAFGSTNFMNTPVGAVTHTDEPINFGVSDSAVFFEQWMRGKRFVSAAWASRRTHHFQAVGDPLTKR